MKTQINLLAACSLLASVLIVPQVKAADPGPAPCTNASLTGSFGYELRGSMRSGQTATIPTKTFTEDTRLEVGEITFNGAGGFTNIFSQEISAGRTDPESRVPILRRDVGQGYYSVSSDCKTGRLIKHGGLDADDCVFFDVAFRAAAVALGSLAQTVPPPPADVGPPTLVIKVLITDGTLTCTDAGAETFVAASGPSPGFPHGQPPRYVSSYTGNFASVTLP